MVVISSKLNSFERMGDIGERRAGIRQRELTRKPRGFLTLKVAPTRATLVPQGCLATARVRLPAAYHVAGDEAYRGIGVCLRCFRNSLKTGGRPPFERWRSRMSFERRIGHGSRRWRRPKIRRTGFA
jgi:hypothetical protein